MKAAQQVVQTTGDVSEAAKSAAQTAEGLLKNMFNSGK
jgi:hypothetical protein